MQISKQTFLFSLSVFYCVRLFSPLQNTPYQYRYTLRVEQVHTCLCYIVTDNKYSRNVCSLRHTMECMLWTVFAAVYEMYVVYFGLVQGITTSLNGHNNNMSKSFPLQVIHDMYLCISMLREFNKVLFIWPKVNVSWSRKKNKKKKSRYNSYECKQAQCEFMWYVREFSIPIRIVRYASLVSKYLTRSQNIPAIFMILKISSSLACFLFVLCADAVTIRLKFFEFILRIWWF